MKDISLSRIAFGVGVIAVGVAALLGSFGIINFNDLAENYWPLALILAGLVILAENPRQNYLWATILIALGVIVQLNVLEALDVNFWQLFWPVVLIIIGWSVLTQRGTISSASTNNVSAILGGYETKNKSRDFKGSKVTAVLGGGSIDLSKAVIKKEATIELFVLMGGVELRVPETWEVRTSAMPILGGIENKTVTTSKSGAPVLNIVGTVVLGGVEIKN